MVRSFFCPQPDIVQTTLVSHKIHRTTKAHTLRLCWPPDADTRLAVQLRVYDATIS